MINISRRSMRIEDSRVEVITIISTRGEERKVQAQAEASAQVEAEVVAVQVVLVVGIRGREMIVEVRTDQDSTTREGPTVETKDLI